jgi:hypothetical protein
MLPAGNLLFAKVKIPILDKESVVKQINDLKGKGSIWDPYRGMHLTPMMGRVNGSPNDFDWFDYTPSTLIEWAEEVLFPFTNIRSRMAILHTPPHTANNEHIDCNSSELNTLQHKFRIVLHGQVDTLYFMTKDGHVSPPHIEEGFIMDGGWPHGMHNTSDETKLTLALGFPWQGQEHYDDRVELLLNRNDYTMPDDIDHLWQK